MYHHHHVPCRYALVAVFLRRFRSFFSISSASDILLLCHQGRLSMIFFFLLLFPCVSSYLSPLLLLSFQALSFSLGPGKLSGLGARFTDPVVPGSSPSSLDFFFWYTPNKKKAQGSTQPVETGTTEIWESECGQVWY